MKLSLLLLLFVQLNEALIKWPFWYNKNEGKVRVNASIGTPSQEVQLDLTLYNFCPGLLIQNSNSGAKGFDPNASSTFKKLDNFYYGNCVNGLKGADNFVIKSPSNPDQPLRQAPFNVVDNGFCSGKSILSLTHTDGQFPNDFLDFVLEDQKEKLVVLEYDNVSRTGENSFSGTLYLGEKPDRCGEKHMTTELIADGQDSQPRPQWRFSLNKIEVGIYAAFDPGSAEFSLDSPYFYLSFETYHQIVRELKIKHNRLLCNSTKDITFTINDYEFKLSSDDYLDKSDEKKGYCSFYGLASAKDKEFVLPNRLFKKYCLVFDMEKKEVGMAERNGM